ncbi:hypothetical protein [Streptomyces cyanogenus]|uniref:hypothetical protein n=1 Tax=Streptomyces cyanogenus TaxID=80860 RepID=UPI001AA1D3AC|nr:hypothetical protein [Streptomyces cyanogenus]
MALGALLCFLNSGGLLEFVKLWKLQRYGVEGEAVSWRQEWISSGHRVFHEIQLPGGVRPVNFIEVGVAPRGPVGDAVPVVYDRRKPKRARTGRLADIELGDEWLGVKLFWVPGLACIAVGTVLYIACS